MPVETFANQPQTTVSSGGTTAPVSGTQETWTVASSASFPAASSIASPPAQFHVADTGAGLGGEIIAVTNVSGTTWTVTRGAESTTTVAHTAGFTVVQVVTAGVFGGVLQSANNLSDVASASAARANLGLGTAATVNTPVPIGSGGTGQATQQAALDALAGAVTSGQVLRGNGTHVLLAAIVAGDVPTLNQNTTGTAANLAGGATLPAYLAPKVVTLTFAGSGTTLVDASAGNAFNLTLTASTTTLGNPSNSVDGEVVRFRITQGSGGSFTLAYGTAYDFGSSGAPALSTAAGKVDILGFEYVASLSKWCYVGSGLGY